jgi:hypothetical protein
MVAAVVGSTVGMQLVAAASLETIWKLGVAPTPSRGVRMSLRSDPCLSKINRCEARDVA